MEWNRGDKWDTKQNGGKQGNKRHLFGKEKYLGEKEGWDATNEGPQGHPGREE